MLYKLPPASASGQVWQKAALAKYKFKVFLIALAQIRLKPKGIFIF